jgi:RNA polymerase sigma factor (sigma-70 family)
MNTDDSQLLRHYAEMRAEEAFAEVVRRHVDLVYSIALRQLNGDTHLAKDVVQQVFTDLAAKAGSVARHRVLAGWLFVSTRYTAAKLVRGEQRRRAREQEVQLMETNQAAAGSADDWERVRPVLDEALADLGAQDREAILLRFFEGRGFAEVGGRLRLSENAARMRVERALDKLHGLLARRGVTSTAGALAAAIAGQAVAAAPAGLAVSVTGAVLASGGAGALTAGATLSIMGMTKLQLGIAAAIAVAGTSGLVIQRRAADELRREIAGSRVEEAKIDRLRAENRSLSRETQEVERWRAEEAMATHLRQDLNSLSLQVRERVRVAEAAELARRAARKAAAQVRVTAALKRAAEQGVSDLSPRVTETVPPVYPGEMRRAGITGEVVVEFTVGADGTVHDAQALKSTRPEFEGDAEDALMQWKFEPGIKGKRPVNTRLSLPITFGMRDSNLPAGELKPVDRSGGSWLQ